MGVIYKLTEDVVAYILDEKQKSSELSCRELVDLVAKQFGRVVSKSSVHEVLKEANIVSPRGRKSKNKFQIPVDKKAQLIANLPPAIIAAIPAVPAVIAIAQPTALEEEPLGVKAVPEHEEFLVEEEPLKLRVEPMMPLQSQPSAEPVRKAPEFLPPLDESDAVMDARVFFMQAAFYDLFPKAWIMFKTPQDLHEVDADVLKKESAYRSLSVACLKAELQDGGSFFMDGRGHSVSSAFIGACRNVPIEAAMMRMADTVLNNIKPLIIRQMPGDFLGAATYDLLRAMNNGADKHMTRIVLLDKDGQELVDFSPLPRMKRDFILGLSVDNQDITQLTKAEPAEPGLASTYIAVNPVRFISHRIMVGDWQYRGIVILLPTDVPVLAMISNMETSVTDEEIVAHYVQAYPLPPFAETPEGQQVTETDLVLRYAAYLFGDIVLGQCGEQLASLITKNSFNAGISITTICVTTSYNNIAELERACALLNGLNIKDHQGRKIWARLG